MSLVDQRDPRYHIQTFQAGSVSEYFRIYREKLSDSLTKLDLSALEQATQMIAQARVRGAMVYVAGNGGSAAIADHLCCDWTKGTYVPHRPSLRTYSLAANSAMLTAVGNDFGYQHTFSAQVEMLAQAGDVLLAISSSGNSANIVAAAQGAKAKGMQVIAVTGFGGGTVREFADVTLHIPVDNYGIVEDAHQAIMHIISQFLLQKKN